MIDINRLMFCGGDEHKTNVKLSESRNHGTYAARFLILSDNNKKLILFVVVVALNRWTQEGKKLKITSNH